MLAQNVLQPVQRVTLNNASDYIMMLYHHHHHHHEFSVHLQN